MRDAPADITWTYALVYHACPECRRTGLQTTEGMVEVDREEVERILGDAHVETISTEDQPAA